MIVALSGSSITWDGTFTARCPACGEDCQWQAQQGRTEPRCDCQDSSAT